MPADVVVDGLTCVPWVYRPGDQVLERLEWLTDVIPAYDGSEQRIRLRGSPRRAFEGEFLLSGRDRRTAENLLHGSQARDWAVPVWMDAQTLSAPVSGGSTVLSVDTTTRDFHAGGAVYVGTGPDAFEVKSIASLTSSSITLSVALGAGWPAGTEVLPLRAARMPADFRLSRFDFDTIYGRVRFECIGGDDGVTGADPGPTYRSAPVLTLRPNWTEDVDARLLRKLAALDAGTGPLFYDDESDGPVRQQSHRWLLSGRAEIHAFRQWLYARQGRLVDFWLPSWAADLVLVASAGSGATQIDVEACGYTDRVAQDIGRRDIRIELASGSSITRRITASTVVSASVERLTIDSALGTAIAPADVVRITFLDRVRLDADAAEIAWWTWDTAESRLLTRGSRNDL
jgi:hypothetical protein